MMWENFGTNYNFFLKEARKSISYIYILDAAYTFAMVCSICDWLRAGSVDFK